MATCLSAARGWIGFEKKIEEENLNEIFEEHRRNCNETEQNEYN